MANSFLIKKDLLLNNTEILKEISKASLKNFITYDLLENGVIHTDRWHDLESASTIEECYQKYGWNIVQCALQLKHSNTKRKTRLKDRINDIIKDALNRGLKVYFITFTFSPELMLHTCSRTRRRYIQRVLKKTCIHYVANIDFGVDPRYTEREHFHAVASCRNIQALIDLYKELTDSRIFIETIKLYANYTKTNHKLAKYISKLSNHALKESAVSQRICYIFDRNKEYLT